MESSRLYVYFVLGVVGLFCALGDATIYHWVKVNRWQFWVISCVLWVIAATLLGVVFRADHFAFGVASILSLVAHCAVVLSVDRFYYGTKLSNLQWAGVVCFLVGILCIEASPKSSTKESQVAAGQTVDN